MVRPRQSPADYLPPLPGPSPDDMFHMGSLDRELDAGYYSKIPEAPLEAWGEDTLYSSKTIHESQKPYQVESINLATGDYQIGPLSLLESNRLGMALVHTGGMWGSNAQNTNLVASMMFAGRRELAGTFMALDEDMEKNLKNFISPLAYSNWLKGVNVHLPELDKPSTYIPVRTQHFEPMFIGEAWEQFNPNDLFLEEPHPDYTPDKAWALMWEKNPGFMNRISKLGANEEYFADAKNEHEWMHNANMLIELNYITKSKMWSDDTSWWGKNVSGQLYTFVVSGILNEPDMVGEMLVGLLLTAATAGIGGVALTAKIATYMRKGVKIMDELAELRTFVSKVLRMSRVTNFLPSAIPHTFMTRGGKVALKSRWFNPFANKGRNIFMANAAEGALTGTLAEIGNQRRKINWELQDEYDWEMVAWQGGLESIITPFINPAFVLGMKGLQRGSMRTMQFSSQLMTELTGTDIDLGAKLPDVVKNIVKVWGQPESATDRITLDILGNMAWKNLENMLGSLDADGRKVTGQRLGQILAMLLEDGKLDSLQGLETTLELMIKEATVRKDDGTTYIDHKKMDLPMAVAKLAAIAAKKRGLTADEIGTHEATAFFFIHGERIASERNKKNIKRKDGSEPVGDNKWTAPDIITEALGGTEIDIAVFFDEAMRAEVDEELTLGGLDPKFASKSQVAAAWEKAMVKRGATFAKRASAIIDEQEKLIKEVSELIEAARQALDIREGDASYYMNELVASDPELKRRLVELENFTNDLQALFNQISEIRALRESDLHVKDQTQANSMLDIALTSDRVGGMMARLKLIAKALNIDVKGISKISDMVAILKQRVSQDERFDLEAFKPLAEHLSLELSENLAVITEEQSNLEKVLIDNLFRTIANYHNVYKNSSPHVIDQTIDGVKIDRQFQAIVNSIMRVNDSNYEVLNIDNMTNTGEWNVTESGTKTDTTEPIFLTDKILLKDKKSGDVLSKGEGTIHHVEAHLLDKADPRHKEYVPPPPPPTTGGHPSTPPSKINELREKAGFEPVEVELSGDPESNSFVPLDFAESVTVYQTLQELIAKAEEAGDTKLAKELKRTLSALRFFAENHLDTLPITEAIVDIQTKTLAITKRMNEIDEEFMNNEKFKANYQIEADAQVVAVLSTRIKNSADRGKIKENDVVLDTESQEALSSLEDSYKIKPKKGVSHWKRLAKIRTMLEKKSANFGAKYLKAKEKHNKEITTHSDEIMRLKEKQRSEIHKINMRVIEAHLGEHTGLTLATGREIAEQVATHQLKLARKEADWKFFWEEQSTMTLNDFIFQYLNNNQYVRTRILKKHGTKEEGYTKKQLQEYWDQAIKKEKELIDRLHVGRMMATQRVINNLATEILEEKGVTIDNWNPEHRFTLDTLPDQRLAALAAGDGVTSHIETKLEAVTLLSQFARRIIYMLNTPRWSDETTLKWDKVKKALPPGIKNLRIEIVFAHALTPDSKNKANTEMLEVLELEFDVELLKGALADLITLLDPAIKEQYKYTARMIREAQKDPTDTHSEYSWYAAQRIVTMLWDAMLPAYRDEFLANEIHPDHIGRGYKLVHSKGVTTKWGTESDYIIAVGEEAKNMLLILPEGIRKLALERLGIKETAIIADIDPNTLLTAMASFMHKKTAADLAKYGNGTEDYNSAFTTGRGIIEIVLDRSPGTMRRVVDKSDPEGVVDNFTELNETSKESAKRFKKPEKEKSKVLLPPHTGDINMFGPLEEWGLIRTLEDEVFRNRIKFSAHVEITDSIRNQWADPNRVSNVKEDDMFNVGRRLPFRLTPYINNRLYKGTTLDRQELLEALFTVQLDMPAVVQSFIYDAVIGHRQFYASEAKTTSEIITTGWDTVMPSTNLAWVNILQQLNPELLQAENVDSPLVQLVLEEALRWENQTDPDTGKTRPFNEIINQYNYGDQSWQGAHLFWFLNRKGDEFIAELQRIHDEGEMGWNEDLADRYITTAVKWIHELLSTDKDSRMDIFRDLFKKVGITEDTDYDTIRTMQEEDGNRVKILRDALFKPGPLMTLYGGGKEAQMVYYKGDGRVDLVRLNEELDVAITLKDIENLQDFMFGGFMWEGTTILHDAMDYSVELKRAVFKLLAVEGTGGARSQAAIESARAGLQKISDDDGGDYGRMLMRASDALVLLRARIADISEFTEIPVKIIEERYATRLRWVRGYLKKKAKANELVDEYDMARLNEFLLGDRLGWRDVENLRAQNLQNSVAHYMNLDHMRIQARMEGYNFDQDDTMGLEELALYFTQMRSHDSKRWYHTVYDAMNVQPVNVSASKIATVYEGIMNTDRFAARVEELANDPDDPKSTSPEFNGMSQAEVFALSEMLQEEGGAPFGMWDIKVNNYHAAKERFGALDERGQFIKDADRKKWKVWAEREIEDALLRDEMLYEASYGPLALTEYEQGGVVTTKGGREFDIFSEMDPERMYGTIAQRWHTADKAAEVEHRQIVNLINKYEAFRSMGTETEAAGRQILTRVSQWSGIPIDLLPTIKELGIRIGTNRYPVESPYTRTVKPLGDETHDVDDFIGIQTAHPGGYAAMRPAIKKVAWDQVGSLALRKFYYDRKINDLETRINPYLDPAIDPSIRPVESLENILPEHNRTDFPILSDKQNILYPESLRGFEAENLLSGRAATVQSIRFKLEEKIDIWARNQGWDIQFLKEHKELYLSLYYMMKLDDMFGYVDSGYRPPEYAEAWNIMRQLETVGRATRANKPGEMFKAKYDIIEKIRKIYRISHGMLTRTRSMIDLHDKGAVLGTVYVPGKGKMTYEEALVSGILGPNALTPALELGLQAADLMVLDADNNLGEYIATTETKEGTQVIQGIDSNMLVTKLPEQFGLDTILIKMLEDTGRLTKEQIAGYEAGSYKSIIDPTGKNGITSYELLGFVQEVFRRNREDRLSNYDLVIFEVREESEGRFTPLNIQVASRRDHTGVQAIVKRDPLNTGITLTPRSYIGPTKRFAMTPESIFHALNTLGNFHAIEMMEYTLRTGMRLNVREKVQPDGTVVLTPREALSDRMRQDMGFSFRQDRKNEQLLYEAFRLMLGEDTHMDLVEETREIDGSKTKFINARTYINHNIDIKFHKDGPSFSTSVHRAALISPLQRVMQRLNYFGSNKLNGDLDAFVEAREEDLLMVIGTMIRKPEITAEEMSIILPFIMEEKVIKKDGESTPVLEHIRDLQSRAEYFLQEILNELRWRELSSTVKHLHEINTPKIVDKRTGRIMNSWQSKTIPFDWIARSFWENVSEESFKVDLNETEFYEQVYKPHAEKIWDSVKATYSKTHHKDILDFLERHKEELMELSYKNALETMFNENLEEEPRAESVLLKEDMDARWRKIQEIDPQKIKQLRTKAALLKRWEGSTTIYPHLVHVLSSIDTLVKDKVITEQVADATRSMLAWMAEKNPQIFVNMKFESKENIPGIYVAFAQKVNQAESGVTFDGIYRNDPEAGVRYEPDEDMRTTKNLLYLTGLSNEQIDAMPEFQEGWLDGVDAMSYVVGFDMETTIAATPEGRDILMASIKSRTDGDAKGTYEKNLWTAQPIPGYANIRNEIETIKSNHTRITLSEDGTHYHAVGNPDKKYARVTQAIRGDVDPKEMNQKAMDIGTNIDVIVRDFFAGELKGYLNYHTDGNPHIKTEEIFDSFIEQLEELKQKFDRNGDEVIANNIVLYSDELEIAGTVDLLVYNEDKQTISIYDMKTKRRGAKAGAGRSGLLYNVDTKYEAGSYRDKWTNQLNLYSILLNHTHNIDTETLGIIPIAVAYDGRVKARTTDELTLYETESIKELPEVTLLARDEGASRNTLAQDGGRITQEQAQDMLNTLEMHQNRGGKVVTHNGNEFDLLTLGHIADNPRQAARIALRGYDIMQILMYAEPEPGRSLDWFGLNDAGLNTIGRGKIDESGLAPLYSQQMLGQELEDLTGEVSSEAIAKIKEMDPAMAGDKLRIYVEDDANLTADLLVGLWEKSQSDNKALDITNAKGATRVTMHNAHPSWKTASEIDSVPGSVRKFNNNGLITPRSTHIPGDPSLDPAYLIGLDAAKLSTMDTASAVEIIFHEVMEVAILKYMREDTAAFDNLVEMLERKENIKLLERMILAQSGGKSGPSIKARMEYFTSSPTELIAAFASYYVAAKVLGDPEGVVAPIINDLHKSSAWSKLKEFMNKTFRWVGDIYRDMSHVFVSFIDEPGGQREFDDLMTLLNTVFGLDQEGNMLLDANNDLSKPRYSKDWRYDTPYQLAEEPAEILEGGDKEYLKKYNKIQTLSDELDVLMANGKGSSKEYRNKSLLSRKLHGEMVQYGYVNNNPKTMIGTEGGEGGRHVQGLTRGEQLSWEQIIRRDWWLGSGPDGLAILNSGNIYLKAAFAHMTSQKMSDYLGGHLSQGVGGTARWFADFFDRSGVSKYVMDNAKKFILASSGANVTYNSPFVISVILANMMVDGATITRSSVLPHSKGIVSVQAAHRKATGFEKAVGDTFSRDVIKLFEKSPYYKNALESGETKGDLVQNLQTEIIKILVDQKDKRDYSGIEKYDDGIQKGIKNLDATFRSFVNQIFGMSKEQGRAYMEKDTEMVPWLVKSTNTGETLHAATQRTRPALKKLFTDKISSASKEYIHPVLAYTAGLLPKPSRLNKSLEMMQIIHPAWYRFIATKALLNYRAMANDPTISLNAFVALTMNATVRSAWNKVTSDAMSAKGDRHLMWNDLDGFAVKDPKGKPYDMNEVKAKIRERYDMLLDGEALGDDFGLNNVIDELFDLNNHLDPHDKVRSFYVASKTRRNKDFSSVMDFILNTFLERIHHQAYFVYDSIFTPKVSEALAIPEIRSYLETNPAILARAVSRSQGHRAHEIDMFKEITNTNLDFSELLSLFGEVASTKGSVFRMTDGKGKDLTEKEQAQLSHALNVTFKRKYEVLRGVAARYDTSEDTFANSLGEGSNWIVKSVYGTNLAMATSVVEGSMAGLLSTIGYNDVKGLIFPFLAYLKPLMRQDNEVARGMIYGLRLLKGDTTPGLVDLDTSIHPADTDLYFAKQRKNWWARRPEAITHHASRVNEQLKSMIDLQMRKFMYDKLNKGQWRDLINLIASGSRDAKTGKLLEHLEFEKDPVAWRKREEARVMAANRKLPADQQQAAREKPGYDLEALLDDSKASWRLWKKLATESGWGAKQWRSAMIAAKHGLMTHEALDNFIIMESEARTIAKAEGYGKEGFFHLYKMRQWTEMFAKEEDAAGMLDVYGNTRNALQEFIEIVMVAPNILDLNVVPSALWAILHQYRTYPILFTAQRIVRDSSNYDPFTWSLRVVSNLLLDMLYTLLTMVAGGYRIQDMQDDWEKEPASMIALLATRLPMFGFYGSAAFELMNLVASGRKGAVMAPVSLAGLAGFLGNLVNVGKSGIEAAIPGGKLWDTDGDTQDLINLLRVIPYLGESVVRMGLHQALRSKQSRGAITKYGQNREFFNFGLTRKQMMDQPKYYLAELIGELAPHLIPEDIQDLDVEDWVAIKSGVESLPLQQPEEATGVDTPVGTTPDPDPFTAATERSLRAPSTLGLGKLDKFIKAPMPTPKGITGGKRTWDIQDKID